MIAKCLTVLVVALKYATFRKGADDGFVSNMRISFQQMKLFAANAIKIKKLLLALAVNQNQINMPRIISIFITGIQSKKRVL